MLRAVLRARPLASTHVYVPYPVPHLINCSTSDRHTLSASIGAWDAHPEAWWFLCQLRSCVAPEAGNRKSRVGSSEPAVGSSGKYPEIPGAASCLKLSNCPVRVCTEGPTVEAVKLGAKMYGSIPHCAFCEPMRVSRDPMRRCNFDVRNHGMRREGHGGGHSGHTDAVSIPTEYP